MERRKISLIVEGINIVGELYLPEGSERNYPTLCICHGIPSGKPVDPNDRGYPLLAEGFCNAGFITMIFNFRGTGLSEGNFDFLGWARDLEAAIDYLESYPEVDKSRLYLMGFSGGAAVSAYVAAHDLRVARVVLCACPAEFTSLIDQKKLGSPVDYFRSIGIIRDKDFPLSLDEWLDGFRCISPILWIDKIAPRPLLILYGEKDDLVAADHVWRLYNMAKDPKEIAIIKEGEHKLRLSQKAMEIALEWLGRLH